MTANPIDLTFDGKWYRGCPIPPDFKRWTQDKQDGVYRYIDFIWELKGISRRQIVNEQTCNAGCGSPIEFGSYRCPQGHEQF